MNAVFQEMGACPCGESTCDEFGTKLARALDEDTPPHLIRCNCVRHRNIRNQKKGKRTQARGHRALGGTGFTPSHEESRDGYPIRVQVEHKGGYPDDTALFYQFIGNRFFKKALGQAERAVKVGDGAMPSVMIDGRWLIVDCKRGKDSVA